MSVTAKHADDGQVKRRRQRLEVTRWPAPRCPRCGSIKLHADASFRIGETRGRRTHCRECGHRFTILFE